MKGVDRLNSEQLATYDSFVRARERSLLGFGLLLTADHHAAEDLVQGALTSLYVHWRRVRLPEAEAYARRCMVNANISRWRRVRETAALLPDTSAATDDRVDQRDQLVRALAAIGPRQRTAVVLRHYADLSEAETASLMRCSVGTVKSQTARGVAALRTALLLAEQS